MLAKLSPAWTREYHQRVLVLIRDIANPSSADPYFVTFRHKDWYLGSSWASGIVTIQGSIVRMIFYFSVYLFACMHDICMMLRFRDVVLGQLSHVLRCVFLMPVLGDPYPNGRNQESSAEAIAAYEAVALYGLGASAVFGDSDDPADKVCIELFINLFCPSHI